MAPARRFDLATAVLPVAALAIGFAAVAVANGGHRSREAGMLLLAVAALGGLMPLRYALPVGLVLASLSGFFVDFVGSDSRYVNEAFVSALAVRSLALRRPTRREALAALAPAIMFGGYLASGSSSTEVFWGAKVLLTSVVAGWAIGRLRPGRAEWRSTYHGLAVVAGSALILAQWERALGLAGLRALGLPYHHRLTGAGQAPVLVFGGFPSSAPFAFVLGLSLLIWAAFALTPGADRRLAVQTPWVPACALVGLAWSRDRAALIGLLAVAVVGAARLSGRRAIPILALAGLAVVGIFALGGHAHHTYLGDGLTLRSNSGKFRMLLWRDYLHEASVFGAGPATAGSAYQHVSHERWVQPLRFRWGWVFQTRDALRLRAWMATGSTIIIDPRSPRRPPMELTATMTSYARKHLLTVRMNKRLVRRLSVPLDREVPLRVAIPQGTGKARLDFLVVPESTIASLPDTPPNSLVSIGFDNLQLHGGRGSHSSTLRVYDRIFEQTLQPPEKGGVEPGVVDNQYLSWLFQYGIVGLVLCGVCIAIAFRLVVLGNSDSIGVAAMFTIVFMLVVAAFVNVWEEAPTDFFAAAILAFALARAREHGTRTPRRKRAEASYFTA